MAKDDKKTEAESGASAEGGRGSATNLVMIVVAALISLGLGAGGAFLFASAQIPAAPATPPVDPAALAEDRVAAAQKRGSEDFKERLFALEPFVVNVTGDGYNRFLKLRLQLETSGPEVKEELDARLPQVRDALIVLLSSKQLADITDFEGKALLKEDIVERMNDLTERGAVRSVLFTEFVVQ